MSSLRYTDVDTAKKSMPFAAQPQKQLTILSLRSNKDSSNGKGNQLSNANGGGTGATGGEIDTNFA
jgi:hypothetical protein